MCVFKINAANNNGENMNNSINTRQYETILYYYEYLLNADNVEMCVKNTSRKTILRTRRIDENYVGFQQNVDN